MAISTALIFAGQGAQHPGMGQALYESSAGARRLYDDADRILGWSISKLCFEGPQEELTACAHCQPAIYVTSMAQWAARQEAVDAAEESVAICGGLSLGELAALTAAGAFDFETGLRAVARRGQLMDEACRRHPGGMTAVIGAEPAAVAEAAARHGIDVANYNCPGQMIISGEKEKVAACAAELAPAALKTVPLEVAGAYHSRLMNEAALAFGDFLQGVAIASPALPVVHNVTGTLSEGTPEAIRAHLSAQVCSPVRWEECVRTMLPRCAQFRELGPGKVLAGLVHRTDRTAKILNDGI